MKKTSKYHHKTLADFRRAANLPRLVAVTKFDVRSRGIGPHRLESYISSIAGNANIEQVQTTTEGA